MPTPKLLAQALAAGSLLTLAPASVWAQALPTGLGVASGQAQVSTVGNAMTVTNSANAILNWQSFSIGAGHSVRFQQPDAASAVLNRVLGADPSNILGSLSSNGRVWLLNPNGVLFGQNARVDVASLVISTLRLSDTDWLSGRFAFTAEANGTASIVNQGELRSTLGGRIALVGHSVRNEGLVEAPGGQILLAAGSSVELVDTAAPNLGVRLQASSAEALNLGTLRAAGGRIDIHAAAVNQQGIVSASAIGSGDGGSVVLQATGRTTLGDGSSTSASSAQGSGGAVHLFGTEVALTGSATVDASGARGGGEVLVGGGLQGRDARYPNARAVYVGPDATIQADALVQGDGGRIVLWSNEATRAFGSFSARGGVSGGDGGFIETSGGWLDARPKRVDVSAPMGHAGQWLLDPFNITITDSGEDFGFDAAFTANSSGALILSGTIQSALNAGTNVTVSTGANNGLEAGRVTLDTAHIAVTSPSPGQFTVLADGPIDAFSTSITSTSPMQVTLRSGRASGGAQPFGGISMSGVTIDSGGGNILLGGFSTGLNPDGSLFTQAAKGNSSFPDGIYLSSTTLNAGAGSLTVLGIGVAPIEGSSSGVTVGFSSLSGRDVTVRGWAPQVGPGVNIYDSSVGATGQVTLRGRADSSATGVNLEYAPITVAPLVFDSTAAIDIEGRSNGGIGVAVDLGGGSNGSLSASNGAKVVVRGASGGTGRALSVVAAGGEDFQEPFIQVTGSGSVSLRGLDLGDAIELENISISLGSGGLGIVTTGPLSLIGNQIQAASTIQLAGSTVSFHDAVGSSQTTSTFAGDPAIVVTASGIGVEPGGFFNHSGSEALSTPSGRWIVSLNAQRGDSEQLVLGGLVNGFSRYSQGSFASTDPGNGLLFWQGGAATLFGTANSRTYDGTTAATLSSSIVAGSLGDSLSLAPGTALRFDDKNVGVAKSISVVPRADPVLATDTQGKPVFGYSLSVSPSVFADITAAPLAVSGLSANSKVYDTSTVATLSGTAAVLAFGSDVVGVQGTATGSFLNKNVGVGKAVSVSGLSLNGADSGNYSIVLPTNLAADITAAQLAVNGLAVQNKVYDASTAAQFSGTPSVTALPGDTVSLAGSLTASFADKNAGVNKTVVLSGLALQGADKDNYVAVAPGGLTATITAAPLAVSGLVAQGKVYDAGTVATLTGTAAVTPIGNDVVSVGAGFAGVFNSKNVGVGKAVSVTGLTLVGADKDNYVAVAPSGLTASIMAAPLAVSGLSANNKVYDATTVAALSGVATVSPLGSDSVALNGVAGGAFGDKAVGIGKPVAVSGLSLGGTDATNYSLVLPSNLSASITARTLPVSGLTATNKVYDANVTASLSGTAGISALAGDSVVLSGSAQGSFADKNVGTGKPVTVTGLSLAGADAGNYALSLPSNLAASISQRSISVSGLSGIDKTYDGSALATLGGTATISPIAGDVVSLAGSAAGSFANKNAGNGKAITVSGVSLQGTDAGNYSLQAITGLTASVGAKTLTVSGLTAQNKTYDATATATLGGAPLVAGVVAGDALTLAGLAAGSFADKQVGQNKAVTVTGLSLAGGDAGNYVLAPVTGLKANVTQAALVLGGLSAQNKVYDGTTAATLSGTAGISPFAGDSVSLTGTASGAFVDRNAGFNKVVNVSGLSISGVDAANYAFSVPALRADITSATLTYVANPELRLIGQPIGVLGGSVTGFVGGDALASATTGTLSFSTTATQASGVGLYPINGDGLLAANYRFVQAAGNATAMTIVGLPLEIKVASGATLGLAAAVRNITLPSVQQAVGQSGLADVVASVAPVAGGPAPASRADFNAVRLASLSPDAIRELLDSRDRYKKLVFAESISKLEVNPRLADMAACASLKDARAGTCLVTESQRAELRKLIDLEEQAAKAAPTVPVPGVPQAAAPAPAPLAPVPSSTSAPVAAATAATAASSNLVIERRRVRQASLPQIERKLALIIGVDRYADAAIPGLANAVGDARAMGRLFENDLGYETVVLENASRASVVAALNRMALELRPNDSAVVYYAGHGELIEATKLGYWQLADADSKRPETWLSNSDISRLVAAIPASQVALISDSCYSGSLVTEQRIRAASTAPDPIAVLTRKTVVVMSSGGNEPVFDAGKDGHSPFAYNLMGTLKQVNNWRPGGQIFERVRFAVARELPQRPQYGASSAAGHQPGGDYLFEQRQLEARP